MKKICIIIFTTIYISICLVVTTCLLHFNDYNISVFKNSSLLILKENYDDLKKGSLVIIKKSSINKDDTIFYYDTSKGDMKISLDKVKKIDNVSSNESVYTLNSDKMLTTEFIIGTKNSAKIIPAIGAILGLLESKWGFLVIIILPFSLLFVFEIYTLIKEFKPAKKKRNRSKNEVNRAKQK